MKIDGCTDFVDAVVVVVVVVIIINIFTYVIITRHSNHNTHNHIMLMYFVCQCALACFNDPVSVHMNFLAL
jgi:hypothetical protein